MKKSIFACALLAAFLATSCNSNNSARVYNDGFKYSKEMVYTSTLAKKNIDVYENNSKPVKVPEMKVENAGIDKEDVVDQNYSSHGLLVTKNDAGNIGFYSFIAGDYILNHQYEKEWLKYSVNYSNSLGFVLIVRYEDSYKMIDSYGNVLYNGNNQPAIKEEHSGKKTYVIVSDDNFSTETIYLYDNATGNVTEVTSITPEEQEDEDEYEGPEVNNLYKDGWKDLTPYGMDGVYLVNDPQGLYYTMNAINQVRFFVDPETCTPLGVVGHNFVYQQVIPLFEENTNYAFSNGDTKYSLETFFVNLETGEKKTVNYLALFTGLTPLKDNDVINYYILDYQVINKNFVVAEHTSKIIDSEFVIHDDLGGISFQDFIKYDEVIYNQYTGYLYDDNLEPITYIGNTNPKYIPNMHMFLGNYEGKYGIIDSQGKVAVEFVYDEICCDDYQGNNLIATIGNDAYRLTLYESYENAYYLGTNLTRHNNNLFSCTKGSYKHYFSSSQDLFAFKDNGDTDIQVNSYLNNYVINFFENNTESDYYHFSQIGYDDYDPQTVPSETKGQTVSTQINNGENRGRPQKMELGYHQGHNMNNYSTSTHSFNPVEKAYYSLYLAEDELLANVYYRQYNSYTYGYESVYVSTDYRHSDWNIADKEYTHRYTFLLDDTDRTYYFEIVRQFNTYNEEYRQLFDYYLYQEAGYNANYPMFYSFEEEVTNKFVYNEDVLSSVSQFYVSFTPEETGYYDLNHVTINEQSVEAYADMISGGVYDPDENAYLYVADQKAIVRIVVNESFSTDAEFSFEFTKFDIPEGFSSENPIQLSYGDNVNAGATLSGRTFSKYLILDTVYFKFAPEHSGTFSFNTPSFYNSVTSNGWKYYNEKGEDITEEVNDNYYNGYYLKQGDYAVYSFTFNYYSSTQIYNFLIGAGSYNGRNEYNPTSISGITNYLSVYTGVSNYFKYTAQEEEAAKFQIESSSTFTVRYMVARYDSETSEYTSGEYEVFEGQYTPVLNLNANDYVMFELDTDSVFISYHNSYTFTWRKYLQSHENEVEFELNQGQIYDPSQVGGYGYYFYENKTSESQTVYITKSVTYIDHFGISRHGYYEDSMPSITYLYDNRYELEPGEKLFIIVSSGSSVGFMVTDETPDYLINVKYGEQSKYWYGASGGYFQTPTYSSYSSTESTFCIQFYESGTFSFNWFVNGPSYGGYISLIVWKNELPDGQLVYSEYGGNNSVETEVNPGDVIYFRWSTYYNVYSSSFYAAISNFSFTAQPIAS